MEEFLYRISAQHNLAVWKRPKAVNKNRLLESKAARAKQSRHLLTIRVEAPVIPNLFVTYAKP
jgi:hypothetical protein